MLDKGEAVGRADLEDGEVGDDLRHAAGAGQRERALGQNLGVALLIGVFLRLLASRLLPFRWKKTYHSDNNLGLLGVGDQVHGTANTLDLTGKHEVGEISVLADLQSTKHGQVDAASADHAETLVGSKQRSTLAQSDSLLSRVDKVGVLLAGAGVAAQTEDTVLSLQEDFDAFGEVRGSDKRHSDTEVDIHAVLEFLGGTLDDAFTTGSGLARA